MHGVPVKEKNRGCRLSAKTSSSESHGVVGKSKKENKYSGMGNDHMVGWKMIEYLNTLDCNLQQNN